MKIDVIVAISFILLCINTNKKIKVLRKN